MNQRFARVLTTVLSAAALSSVIVNFSIAKPLENPLHLGSNLIAVKDPGIYLVVCHFPSKVSDYTENGAAVRFWKQPAPNYVKRLKISLRSKLANEKPVLFISKGTNDYYPSFGSVVQLLGAFWCSSKSDFYLDIGNEDRHIGNSDIEFGQFALVKLGKNFKPPVGSYYYRTKKAISVGDRFAADNFEVAKYPPEVFLDSATLPTLLLDSPKGMICKKYIPSGHEIQSNDLVLPEDQVAASQFLIEKNLAEN